MRCSRPSTTPAGAEPGVKAIPSSLPTLFSDWSPRDAEPHRESVEVYSNCEQVELFLNGTSLGSQFRPADAAPRLWKVPFEPGTLRAVGKNAGQCIAILRANAPAGLILLTATAAGFAPASVTVQTTDRAPIPPR